MMCNHAPGTWGSSVLGTRIAALVFLALMMVSLDASAEVKQVINLGESVSRPTLTYAQVGTEIHAALIVGCGDDPVSSRAARAANNVMGRCVLVVKAATGEIIRRFETGNGLAGDTDMDAPMVGSPAVYPARGLLPASRAYLGDAAGRLWRLDMRSSNPNNWEMSVAWPVDDEDLLEGYTLGREIVSRPGLFVRESGKVGIVFGTGKARRDDAGAGYVVSLTDELVLGRDDRLNFEAKPEWVMPLRRTEHTSGSVLIRAGVSYFTTIQGIDAGDDAAVCDSGVGRLYGVDATRTGPEFQTVDGRRLKVKPALPTLVNAAGQRVTDAIAIVLSAGNVAYGLAMVTSPSCVEGEEPTTEVIISTSSSQGGAADPADVKIERKTGRVAPGNLDDDFVREGDTGVSIVVKGGGVDEDEAGGGASSAAPFPRRVLYWGSTFAQ